MLSGGFYLDDLVDLVVVLLVCLGQMLAARHHLAFRVLDAAVAVGRRGRVGRGVVRRIPLVVGACGVGLEVVGGRGCPRRGTRVGMHGGGGLVQEQAEVQVRVRVRVRVV